MELLDKIKIKNLYLDGKTYKEIGEVFGFTRQRAQQILAPLLSRQEVLEVIHRKSSARHILKESKISPEKKQEIALRRLVTAGLRWSYYSESCLGCGSAERKHSRYGYCYRCSYHFVPGIKELRLESTAKYNKKYPEKKKLRDTKYAKAFIDRLKSKPGCWEEYLNKQKEREAVRLGGEDNRLKYHRMLAEKSYQKHKEKLLIEKSIRVAYPDYRDPLLEERRARERARYHRTKKLKKPL